MRSKIAQRIYNETPMETKINVKKYGDTLVKQSLQEPKWLDQLDSLIVVYSFITIILLIAIAAH